MDKIRPLSVVSLVCCTLSCLTLLAENLYGIILQNGNDLVKMILSGAFWVFLIAGVALIFVLRTLSGGNILNFWRTTKAVDILILVFVAVYVLCNLLLKNMLPQMAFDIISTTSYTAFLYCFLLHCILILNHQAHEKYQDL